MKVLVSHPDKIIGYIRKRFLMTFSIKAIPFCKSNKHALLHRSLSCVQYCINQ